MAYTTPNLGLKVWDQDSDAFSRADLITNWEAIDDDYARQRSANQIESLAEVPVSSNFDGRLVYLTAANSGFPSKTLIRYNGTTWRAVGPAPEIFAALPTVSNYQGRIIALTAASGGFAANDVLVNTDGANNWKKAGGIGVGAALPGSPVSGDIFLLNAAASGFPAWSLVVYDGASWLTIERRGVQVGATLPVSPYAGQIYVVNTAVGGFAAWDVVRYNGSAWGKVNGSSSYVSGTWPVSPADGDLILVPWGNQIGHFRYNAGSASSYKWEHIGAGPIVWAGGLTGTYVVPKTGEYFIHWQNNYGGVADNTGSRATVVDVTAGSVAVTGEIDNGNFGSQKSGITVSHYSTGGIMWPVTLTAAHTLRLDGNYSAPYGAMANNFSAYAVQPIRVQA